MPGGFMNPKYQEMMEGAKSEGGGEPEHKPEHKKKGGHRAPHIHIHPHHDESGAHVGTTVHTMHSDGRHEAHEFGPGDHQAVGEHVAAQLSGEGAAPEGHEAMGEEALPGER